MITASKPPPSWEYGYIVFLSHSPRGQILFRALDRLSEPGVFVSKSYNIPDAAFEHKPALKISVDCTVWYIPEGHVLVPSNQAPIAFAIVGPSGPHM